MQFYGLSLHTPNVPKLLLPPSLCVVDLTGATTVVPVEFPTPCATGAGSGEPFGVAIGVVIVLRRACQVERVCRTEEEKKMDKKDSI